MSQLWGSPDIANTHTTNELADKSVYKMGNVEIGYNFVSKIICRVESEILTILLSKFNISFS